MTRGVTHAREAVAASQRAANKSAAASAEAPSQGAAVTSASTTVVTKHAAARASDRVVAKHVVHVSPTPHKVAAGAIPAQQAAVESELKQGKVVAVLFWNPKGADDVAVRGDAADLLVGERDPEPAGSAHRDRFDPSPLALLESPVIAGCSRRSRRCSQESVRAVAQRRVPTPRSPPTRSSSTSSSAARSRRCRG